MHPKTTRYDTAVLLNTKKDITAYLNAVFEEDDPALIAHALGVVARSEGMAEIAKQAGLTRPACTRRCRRAAARNLPRC